MSCATMLTRKQMLDMVQDVDGDPNSIEVIPPDKMTYVIHFEDRVVFEKKEAELRSGKKQKFTRKNPETGQTGFYITVEDPSATDAPVQESSVKVEDPYIRPIPPKP